MTINIYLRDNFVSVLADYNAHQLLRDLELCHQATQLAAIPK